jgi:hypothetical protein
LAARTLSIAAALSIAGPGPGDDHGLHSATQLDSARATTAATAGTI